jgi:hypothetical protein
MNLATGIEPKKTSKDILEAVQVRHSQDLNGGGVIGL